jgi:hypothetical protein
MGGLVEFLAASSSPGIQVAVGFDPVDVNSMAANAVPAMQAFPMVLRASIQSVCNLAAPAEPAVIAAFPGPYEVLTVANTMHCDPEDPEMQACILSCTATVAPPYTCSPNPGALLTFRRDAGIVTNVTLHNIPGGCAAPFDAGPPTLDAGLVIGGVDAGTEGDAGATPVTDAGMGVPTQDGGTSSDAGSGSKSRPDGCGCSGLGDLGFSALIGIAARRRKDARRAA